MTSRLVPLREVCRQDRTTVKPGDRRELRYIGLESVEGGTGLLAQGELSKTPDDPQANSFAFDTVHVLYGKLRPYLNKVLIPDFAGKCSTEIIPLLPSSDLDRSYLAYFLRSASIVERISAKTAGARMPRADMDFVLGLELPLPSIAEQRLIVDLLSRAEGIVRLCRQAQTKAQAIIPALFLDIFGDPARNPKGWEARSLPSVLARPFKNGLYLPKDQYVPDGRPDGVEMVHMSDAFYGEVKRGSLRRVLADASLVCDYGLTSSDLLVARRSLNFDGAAKLCSIPWHADPLLFESSFIRLTPNHELVLTEYLLHYLNNEVTRSAHIKSRISGITVSGINQAALSQVPVLCPPLDLQRRFCDWLATLKSVDSLQRGALRKAEATFQALLSRAFSGDHAAPQIIREEALA